MAKTKSHKQKKGIKKNGNRIKINTGGKKMAEEGYVDNVKIGPHGTWLYRFKIEGKPYTGDTKKTRRFEAIQEVIKIRAEKLENIDGVQKKKPIPFTQAVSIWKVNKLSTKTIDYVNNIVRLMEVHFIPYIGTKHINKITKGDFKDCLIRYATKTQAGKDIKCFGGYNKLIGMLHGIMNMMIEEKYITSFELPEEEDSQEKDYDVISQDDIYTLFDAIKERYGLPRAVGLALGCFCGLRASEITTAQWHMIDWNEKVFNSKASTNTKNKKNIELPICDDMLNMLKELKGEQEKIGYIMLTPDGKQYNRKFSEFILEQMGPTLFKKKLTCHSLRRSYITILHNAGTPPKTLQKLARHSSLAQTMRYVKIGEVEKKKAIDDVFNRKKQA